MMKTEEELEELCTNFKERAFKDFGLVVEKDDPVMLLYLIIDMLTDDYSKRVSGSLDNSLARVKEIAELWKERENASFNEIQRNLQNNTEDLNQILNQFFATFDTKQKDENSKLKKYLTITLNYLDTKTKKITLINSILLLSNVILVGLNFYFNI